LAKDQGKGIVEEKGDSSPKDGEQSENREGAKPKMVGPYQPTIPFP